MNSLVKRRKFNIICYGYVIDKLGILYLFLIIQYTIHKFYLA